MRFARAAGLAFIAVVAAAPFSIADEKSDFVAMCVRVSIADGLPQEAIAPFCSCMSERASQDQAIYRELWNAAESQPNVDARLAMLSQPGRDVVLACRAPPPRTRSVEPAEGRGDD